MIKFYRILAAKRAIPAVKLIERQILYNFANPCHVSCSKREAVRTGQMVRFVSTSDVRKKYKKPSRGKDDDSEDANDLEFKDERDSKVIKTKVNSLRADLILRSGLNIARNKIEVIFYESKIRVNGAKLTKKSEQLQIGDEIDVIKGFSNINPSHLIVARVLVLSGNAVEDGINVHLRRYKSLLIENYPGVNSYKSTDTVAS